MSKKHKKSHEAYVIQSAPAGNSSHAAEYSIIRHDLVRVVILNVIYLAALLTLYYTNARTGYLETWFSRVLHF